MASQHCVVFSADGRLRWTRCPATMDPERLFEKIAYNEATENYQVLVPSKTTVAALRRLADSLETDLGRKRAR